MGGGHGHNHLPPIPDYRIYKVEDAPELIKIRDKLAEKGLKDPWLRNEVWRYHKEFPRPWTNARIVVFRGFGVGVGLLGLTILYDKLFASKDDHGHGHH